MRQNSEQQLVFGYVRVSTENQLENYSIDEQVQRITGYCRAKGWALLKIYTDGGYSGGNTQRPGLQQMLQAIRTNEIDAVVVYKLDRLSRSQKDTLVLIEDEFLAHGVDFVSINENFDTSAPFGRAMIGMLSVFAQLEKDQITERFTMGRIGRSKAGYFHGGGNAPTGYDYVNGELIVNEYQAAQVREIYDGFLAGKSINAIWRDMEKKYGGSWSATKIRNILRNSVYIGKVKFADVEYEGQHQPILSEEKYREAQRLLSPEVRLIRGPQKTPFRAETLLSGLIYCGRCGARYCGNHGYYKCYSRAKCCAKYVVDPNCKNENWEIEALDREIVGAIKGIASNSRLLTRAAKSSDSPEPAVNRKSAEKRIREIDAQTEKLIDLYQVGTIPMEAVTKRVNELALEKGILSQQIQNTEPTAEERKAAFEDSLSRFLASFDTAPLETQRLLIASLVQSVTIEGQNVDITWRI